MSKEQSICKRIIFLSEQIAIHKKLNEKQQQLKFIYSRLASKPPSAMFIDSIIDESKRFIEEMENDIKRLMLPLLKGIEFDIKISYLSSRDIYIGYIELYDASGKEYILFFKPFDNGLIHVVEGSLELNDKNQITAILEQMKPIKKDPETKTLFNILMNQK